MKHLFIMLLIACSALTTANAQQKNKPENVIKAFEFLIGLYGQKAGQTYSVEKNPNTGIIESSERIVPFTCKKDEPYITMMGEDFMKDEPLSYQIKHITPGQGSQNFTLAVHTNVPNVINHYAIRTKSAEEMWFMACKNPDNPSLRDAYAIVWQPTADNKVKGTIYMITSPRPSNFGKAFDNPKKVFKIEGRVDANIKDSLYNIYIAESREALYNLQDHEYVACVPVVNKRFEWQTELTKPCVGRLRCIFPDGELCSAWIDLDFVPGETYHITVHNGYYDDDEDYERRVGRNSGKSLIQPRSASVIGSGIVGDDIIGKTIKIDKIEEDATTVEEDAIAVDEPVYNATNTPPTPQTSSWKPSEQQTMQIELKVMAVKTNMEAIKATYQSLKPFFDAKNFAGTDQIFAQITKQNKALDENFQDIVKFLKTLGVPYDKRAKFFSEGYKEILKFYTEQNQGFTEILKEFGTLPKGAQKAQKELNKLIEKNMKEMSKAMSF